MILTYLVLISVISATVCVWALGVNVLGLPSISFQLVAPLTSVIGMLTHLLPLYFNMLSATRFVSCTSVNSSNELDPVPLVSPNSYADTSPTLYRWYLALIAYTGLLVVPTFTFSNRSSKVDLGRNVSPLVKVSRWLLIVTAVIALPLPVNVILFTPSVIPYPANVVGFPLVILLQSKLGISIDDRVPPLVTLP